LVFEPARRYLPDLPMQLERRCQRTSSLLIMIRFDLGSDARHATSELEGN
jgi:hypothetical protein